MGPIRQSCLLTTYITGRQSPIFCSISDSIRSIAVCASLDMPKSPQDIYARHLISPRGYPLWMPEPSHELLVYRRDGLRIGDVGVVIPEDGCFDVFFNICLPQDHPFHQATGVPNNFKPIELSDTDIRTAVDVENPGRVIANSSVKSVRIVDRPADSSGSSRYVIRSLSTLFHVTDNGSLAPNHLE